MLYVMFAVTCTRAIVPTVDPSTCPRGQQPPARNEDRLDRVDHVDREIIRGQRNTAWRNIGKRVPV